MTFSVVLPACAQSTAGSLQSLCWGASACGGIVSAYWSGALIESLGVRGIFLLTSAFPLLLCGAALLVKEDRALVPSAPQGQQGAIPCHVLE